MNKLSEDEIIKGITNIIYTCNEIIEDTDWYDEEEIKSAKEQSKLTQSLLDLYQQEKDSNQWLLKAFDESRNNNIELSKEYCKIQQELQKEKEKNKELTDFIEAIEELKQAKKPITDLVYEMNKFDDEFISKDKIKPFIKAIESWADYIQEDEGCYYKGLNKLAQKLNDTLDGKITPNEKELCVEYELLE